ncbi:PQQ-binding-like beta-propeller repeat protein [Actinomadura scrupuli]|uniref:outer membrane protein assembly factor BamB family protein n=1 Tax=Actinomadura scrupuli TaxID=559629 RepID=UPI003D968254
MAFNSVLPPQARAAGRPTLTVRGVAVGLLVAVGLGIALTLQVRSWTAVAVEAGGSCGSSKGISHGPCPRGTTPMLLLSFFALFPLFPLAAVMIVRSLKAREVARRVFGVFLLGALVAGVYPGLAIFEWAHGKTLGAVWQAPYERSGSEDADGSWISGQTVVRARFDGLIAYDVATGHQRWTFPIPDRQVLCGMSAHLSGDIGLVAYATENKPCDRVAAIELGSGRALWEQALTSTSLSSSTSAGFVDVAGQTAVLKTSEAITGLDLRTGVKRWSHAPGQVEESSCRFDWVGGGGDQVLTKVDCTRSAPKVRALDAATGRQRWESPVPTRTESINLSLLSASPAVVQVSEGGKRGVDSVMAFDEAGRIRATIPMLSADGETLDSSTYGFDAAPVRRLIVGDGALVAATRSQRGKYALVGYSLTDGHRLWRKSLGRNSIETVQVAGGKAYVVTGSSARPEMRTLNVPDGRQQGGAQVLGLDRVDSDTALYVHGDHYVFVGEKGYSPWYHPVVVTKRK